MSDKGVQAFFEESELLQVQLETRRLASYYLRVQLMTIIVLGPVGGVYFYLSCRSHRVRPTQPNCRGFGDSYCVIVSRSLT